MAIGLGLNSASLASQRALARTTQKLATTGERLSSGLRINKAADDAAGLSVASSLHAKSRINAQAIRNLNDGISVMNVAGSALSQLSSITTRQAELAEQAANGVYSSSQRAALHAEANSLVAEYNRIVSSTSFNGLKLLDGSMGRSLNLQAGDSLLSVAFQESTGLVKGDGTFSSSVSFSAGGGIRNTAVGDYNRDGYNDIVVSLYGTARLKLLVGNSDGSYKAPADFGPSSTHEYQIAVDLNKDGILDIASATGGTTAYVMIGNGDGTFRSPTSLTTGPDINGRLITAGDLNGDGAVDLMASNRGDSTVSVILGNGDGTFRATTSYATPGGSFGLALGDFTGDGKLDAFGAASQLGDVLYLLRGVGDGSFTPFTTVAHLPFTGFQIAKAADVNNDGKLDAIVSDYTNNKAFVGLGNGDGTFKTFLSFSVTGNNIVGLDIADINNDGFTDIVTGDPSSGQISALIGNGDGTFRRSFAQSVGAQADAVELADMNRDGVPDLVVSDSNGGPGVIRIAYGNTITSGHSSMMMPALNLTTAQSARSSLGTISSIRENITLQLGTIGASESRVESALRNSRQQGEEMISAYSRIMDADIAEESAEYVRLSIQQKAASAVLAQANLAPNIVLSLLRD